MEAGPKAFLAKTIAYLCFMDWTKLFMDSSSNLPYTHCHLCETMVQGQSYALMKHFRRYPNQDMVVADLEAVICSTCQLNMARSISESSRKNLQAFMEEAFDLETRKKALLSEKHPAALETWLDRCAVTNKQVDDCLEFQVECLMRDGYPLYDLKQTMSPICLSGEALEQMQQCLSKETKENYDQFMDQLTDLPPDLAEWFKRRPVLV